MDGERGEIARISRLILDVIERLAVAGMAVSPGELVNYLRAQGWAWQISSNGRVPLLSELLEGCLRDPGEWENFEETMRCRSSPLRDAVAAVLGSDRFARESNARLD